MGKTGQLRARSWAFTWNNYADNSIKSLQKLWEKERYVFQEEDEGTPHLQGLIRYKNARTMDQLKLIDNTIHWEVCKNIPASINYCTDVTKRKGRMFTNYVKEPDRLLDPMDGKQWKDWQLKIMETIKAKPDARTIHWYWEETGAVGKTSLAKHICMKYDTAIYVSGKSENVKYAIAAMKKKPKVVIWDIPRVSKDYISFEAIESVKNGIFFTGKYESGMVMFNSPHIICFANFEPDKSNMSVDRWDIVKIEGPPPCPPLPGGD